MKNKKIFILPALFATLSASAAVVNVTAGQLDKIPAPEAGDVTLTLTGNADIRDLKLLAELPAGYDKLDMSQLKISQYSAGTPVWEERTYFPANEIPCYLFFRSPLKNIILPNSVTSIADGAFAGCDAKNIVLHAGLLEIGSHAFYDCKSLNEISLPASLQSVGDWAFARCESLKDIDFSQTSVTRIPDKCFINCSSLQQITLSPKISSIGKEVFAGTAIKQLYLQNVSHADSYALVGMTELENVTLNANANLGEGVLMANRNLQSITGSPLDMPRLFVANCSNLVLDKSIVSVENIGEYSLSGTTAKTLQLGNQLQTVKRGALRGVSGLEKIDAIELGDRVPTADENAFEQLNCKDITLVVKDGTQSLWENAPGWQNFNIMSDLQVNIQNAEASYPDSIAATLANGQLSVIAASVINAIEVYDQDGRLIISDTPAMSQWQSAIDTTSKIIIVRVTTDEISKTIKLIMINK